MQGLRKVGRVKFNSQGTASTLTKLTIRVEVLDGEATILGVSETPSTYEETLAEKGLKEQH